MIERVINPYAAKLFFIHLKLELLTQFPVPNDKKWLYLWNQSVNDTEAHPWLGRVDYKLKFLKSVRQFYAHARALSNKPNKIKIG